MTPKISYDHFIYIRCHRPCLSLPSLSRYLEFHTVSVLLIWYSTNHNSHQALPLTFSFPRSCDIFFSSVFHFPISNLFLSLPVRDWVTWRYPLTVWTIHYGLLCTHGYSQNWLIKKGRISKQIEISHATACHQFFLEKFESTCVFVVILENLYHLHVSGFYFSSALLSFVMIMPTPYLFSLSKEYTVVINSCGYSLPPDTVDEV